jgi:hypothetical protein
MKRFVMLVLLVGATAALLVSCGGDDVDTAVTVPGSSDAGEQDRDRDRDQDRERIHQVVDEAVTACVDQDRDRLRNQVQSRLRDQVDDDAYAFEPGTSLELLDEEITVDGEQAEVHSRLRVRAQGEVSDLEVKWRLHYEEGDWYLSELPPCLEGGTTESTIQDQDRLQERDEDQARDREQG